MPVEAPATWSHSSKVLYTETLTELEVGEWEKNRLFKHLLPYNLVEQNSYDRCT